jgi:aminopeptidase N
VTAPSKYQVVSNGLKVEESSVGEGMRLTHWKQSVPISCWLYALGVAEFAVQYVDTFEGKSIQTWVYKQDRDKGFYDYAVPTKHTLEFFSDYVGPFVYEKLANIQSNSVGGGMEAASAIMYYDRLTGERDEQLRNIIIHEVAHQWFGNAVTEYDWDDVWLSEGLTTYFTLRFIEHAYGRDAFIAGLIKARDQVFQLSENNEDYRIVHDNLSDMSKVTSRLTYQKGAWVAHMLCNYIGEEAFHQGIRNYYYQFVNSNTTTADLKRAMEQVSGKNLDEFFTQWLYQGGNIRLEGSWEYNAKDKVIMIELTQLQPQQYNFTMPLEIGISGEKGSPERIEVIQLDKRKISVSIPSPTAPTRVRLDPRTVLLAQWNFIYKE